jgi:hypothetical protein
MKDSSHASIGEESNLEADSRRRLVKIDSEHFVCIDALPANLDSSFMTERLCNASTQKIRLPMYLA